MSVALHKMSSFCRRNGNWTVLAILDPASDVLIQNLPNIDMYCSIMDLSMM